MLGSSTMKVGCGAAWEYADRGGANPISRSISHKRSSPAGKQQQTLSDQMGVSQGMNDLTAELKKLRSETTEASVTAGSDDQSHYVNVSKQVSKLML
jgi:hypothetical protein